MALNTIEEMMKRGALHRFVKNGGEEDMAILSDPPCVVEIAGRKLKVRAMTLENHKRWFLIFGSILRSYEIILESVEWPESASSIEGQRQRWQTFFSADRVQQDAISMIEQTLFREPGNGWWRRHKKWFRKNVTIIELMDLFFYLYLWNCEAVKKNATFLLRRMGFAHRRATLFGGWSRNLGGHSGAQVQPQYPVSPPAAASSSGSAPSATPRSASSNSSASAPPRQTTRRPQSPPPLPAAVSK